MSVPSTQVTVEKTPAYIMTSRARSEVARHFPGVKLLVLVRDPVDRLLSAYEQAKASWQRQDRRPPPPVELYYQSSRSGPIESNRVAVRKGMYVRYLAPWLKSFGNGQIHVISGEDLISRPLMVLKEVEVFLQLPEMFSERNFVKNETAGFYCYRGFKSQAKVKCLGPDKGRRHEQLPVSEKRRLEEFYRPYNQELFRLIGRRFPWG